MRLDIEGWDSRDRRYAGGGNLCSFGITEGIAAGLVAVGVGEGTAAVAAPIILGAGTGALTSYATGGNPLYGAATGALTAGFGELGPAVGSATGIGTTAGDVLTSAAGGAVGAAITGQNVGMGALEGGGSGLISGITSGSQNAGSGGNGTTAPVTAPGASAASTAAPSSIPVSSPDVSQLAGPTSSLSVGGGLDSVSDPGAGGFGGGGVSSGVPGGASATPAPGGITPEALLNAPTGGPSVTGTATPITSSIPSSLTAAPTGETTLSNVPQNSISAAINNPNFDTISSALGKNIGPVVAGGGLLYEALQGQQKPPYYGNIQSSADQLAAQGGQLEGYLKTGTLPPGIQQQLTQAGESAKASIRSQYAALGLSGSSSESQALDSVDQTMLSQGSNIAMSLLNQGVSETSLADQLYTQLMNISMQQDAQLGQAIGGFAAALAGSPSLKIG